MIKESFRESINNQGAMLLDYAYKHHFQTCKIYTDGDYSGADISKIRPQYSQLLHDAIQIY
ncbi:recombinase family protein [Aminipila terrae]|uniref:Recombinase family protein n=1 Tax=Aminipila terrae TaxID=2697030 RepID=A0A6P1M978_9FIRM|nr:recombinase family protein [Aminipila terrae]